MANILIADDEMLLVELLKETLEAHGHKVIAEAYSGKESVKLAKKWQPHVVFMDISMKNKDDGIFACRQIKKNNPDIKVIFMTAYPQKFYEKILKKIPYDGYLEKPLGVYKIISILKEKNIQS